MVTGASLCLVVHREDRLTVDDKRDLVERIIFPIAVTEQLVCTLRRT
jgi:hypothetical protein